VTAPTSPHVVDKALVTLLVTEPPSSLAHYSSTPHVSPRHRRIQDQHLFEHVWPSSLVKLFATVDEVAAMVLYLAGEVSSATSGAILRVDGGVVWAIV